MYAPLAPGVYGISNATEWLYIGQADNIRAALTTRLVEIDPSSTAQQRTGFVFEICDGAFRSSRQDRLIQEYEPKRQQQERGKIH